MFVNTKYLTLKFFFSASSFYPGCQLDTDTPTPYPDNEDLTDTHDGDTEVESEGDWLTVKSAAGLKWQCVKGLLIPFSKWALWVHLCSSYTPSYRDNWVAAW